MNWCDGGWLDGEGRFNPCRDTRATMRCQGEHARYVACGVKDFRHRLRGLRHHVYENAPSNSPRSTAWHSEHCFRARIAPWPAGRVVRPQRRCLRRATANRATAARRNRAAASARPSTLPCGRFAEMYTRGSSNLSRLTSSNRSAGGSVPATRTTASAENRCDRNPATRSRLRTSPKRSGARKSLKLFL